MVGPNSGMKRVLADEKMFNKGGGNVVQRGVWGFFQ